MLLIFVIITIASMMEKTESIVNPLLATRCQNPPDNHLRVLLANAYENFINDIIRGVEYFPPASPSSLNMSMPTNESKRIGETVCYRSVQTNWTTEDTRTLRTCPHHFAAVHRTNRYPYLIMQAVCNCRSCLGYENDNNRTPRYQCMPVLVNKPVLKQGNCLWKSNTYIWIPSYEKVAVSCTCIETASLN